MYNKVQITKSIKNKGKKTPEKLQKVKGSTIEKNNQTNENLTQAASRQRGQKMR